MNEAVGHGKVILFGEHFVVHGSPAIALGISSKAIVELEKSDSIQFATDVQGTIPELTSKAIANVMGAMDIQDKFKIFLTGDLPTCGGLGSSAAFCVALVRAFNGYYNMKLSPEDINKFAFEGEKAFHGNPSGIDNIIATYGGAIEYTKQKGFKQISIEKPFYLAIGITGCYSPTKKMVEKDHRFKESDEEYFQELYDRAVDIVKRGRKALATSDTKLIGELMNENHSLLKEIGVSIDLNEEIIRKFLDAGALGAKVTGGGGGGCCIALAKDVDHAHKLLKAIKPFDGFVTKVNSTQ